MYIDNIKIPNNILLAPMSGVTDLPFRSIVKEFNPGAHGDNIPDWLDDRIDYVLRLLLAYASNMKSLRKIINRKDFGNGM